MKWMMMMMMMMMRGRRRSKRRRRNKKRGIQEMRGRGRIKETVDTAT